MATAVVVRVRLVSEPAVRAVLRLVRIERLRELDILDRVAECTAATVAQRSGAGEQTALRIVRRGIPYGSPRHVCKALLR